ncbi:hypothetical protein [Fundidesulfovibrio putealis]|uniref:hypothetical protein n=1 Tax=Fundidesulfovibrio putealis TaxID=270496 RepID=UPI000407B319|nr:hypothetical protein [Fundidesulfovibrio putealis]
MSISGITTSSTATSLISGTTYSSNTSASSLLAQGQGLDEAKVSKGGQQMSQLSKLQTSDPEKFKAAAQEISDKLAEAAKNSSDEGESSALSDMSSQWAEAAETGDMSSLQPKAPPSGAQNSSQSAAMKFKGQQQSGSGGPMGVMESVVSSVLSGMNISTSSSSSSGSSASSYYSTASSGETAA